MAEICPDCGAPTLLVRHRLGIGAVRVDAETIAGVNSYNAVEQFRPVHLCTTAELEPPPATRHPPPRAVGGSGAPLPRTGDRIVGLCAGPPPEGWQVLAEQRGVRLVDRVASGGEVPAAHLAAFAIGGAQLWLLQPEGAPSVRVVAGEIRISAAPVDPADLEVAIAELREWFNRDGGPIPGPGPSAPPPSTRDLQIDVAADEQRLADLQPPPVTAEVLEEMASKVAAVSERPGPLYADPLDLAAGAALDTIGVAVRCFRGGREPDDVYRERVRRRRAEELAAIAAAAVPSRRQRGDRAIVKIGDAAYRLDDPPPLAEVAAVIAPPAKAKRKSRGRK